MTWWLSMFETIKVPCPFWVYQWEKSSTFQQWMHLSDTFTLQLQFFWEVSPKFLYPESQILVSSMAGRENNSTRLCQTLRRHPPWTFSTVSFCFWSLSCREDKRWQEQLSLSVDSALPGQRLPAHGEALGLCGCRGRSQGSLLSHSISSVEQGSATLVEILLRLDCCSHTFKGTYTSRCQWKL